MAVKTGRKAPKQVLKPNKGKRPVTPHDGKVYQAGGALPGSKSMGPGMVIPKEGKKAGMRSSSKLRGC